MLKEKRIKIDDSIKKGLERYLNQVGGIEGKVIAYIATNSNAELSEDSKNILAKRLSDESGRSIYRIANSFSIPKIIRTERNKVLDDPTQRDYRQDSEGSEIIPSAFDLIIYKESLNLNT